VSGVRLFSVPGLATSAREDSDVDVLVAVDASIGMGFVELAEELERALGRHVDLRGATGCGPLITAPCDISWAALRF